MNIMWVSILIVSLSVLMFNNADIAFSTLLSGSEKALSLTIKLWAIYAFWLGILKIVEKTGIADKICKLLDPVIYFLMGKQSDYVKQQVAINMTSNILGMGNASTPSGIEAIGAMYKGQKVATSAMIMVLILNTTNLQVIPTTIIGLRVLHSSQHPNDIILPTILASIVSVTCGIALAKLGHKFTSKKTQPYGNVYK